MFFLFKVKKQNESLIANGYKKSTLPDLLIKDAVREKVRSLAIG